MTASFSRVALALTGLWLVPGLAHAQPVSGVYVNLGGGGNALQDQQTRPSPALGISGRALNWNVGSVAVASLGYGFGNGFRVEVEAHDRFNALHEFGGSPIPLASGGEQNEYGAMVNGYFDMDIGSPYVFPYLGLGAGFAHVDLHKVYGVGTSSPFDLNVTDSYNGLGYQGIFGLSFPSPFLPGLSLTAEYRFFGVANDQDYRGALIAGDAGRERHGEIKLFNDFNHSFLIGLRYEFNPAPPPPPPAPAASPAVPAPQAARSFLVFFDWDRADLTARARQIVAQAASASRHATVTRIEVNGYTDLSGAPAYNQALSLRRANAVAGELVHDGVPKDEISVAGYGEQNPAVATAQGVREPQNRRVEIILREGS